MVKFSLTYIREHIIKHTNTTFKRPSGVATISLKLINLIIFTSKYEITTYILILIM